ncbi:206_t:CDS:1, partial [Gigaspora rosea]
MKARFKYKLGAAAGGAKVLCGGYLNDSPVHRDVNSQDRQVHKTRSLLRMPLE